jgi:hypothetical protein
MKKKMLLLGSIGAMLLSAALLVMPANAAITSTCSGCTFLDSNGNLVTVACKVRPIDLCSCPVIGNLVRNNCLHL